jgi:hypothetical protein
VTKPESILGIEHARHTPAPVLEVQPWWRRHSLVAGVGLVGAMHVLIYAALALAYTTSTLLRAVVIIPLLVWQLIPALAQLVYVVPLHAFLRRHQYDALASGVKRGAQLTIVVNVALWLWLLAECRRVGAPGVR